MKNILMSACLILAILTSCSNDDDSINMVDQVEAPLTYQFSRNGSSTVNFEGQTTRIQMAQELNTAFRDNTKSATELQNMFAHIQNESDFSEPNLNSSDKNIRSKVAASKDYFSANTTVSNSIKSTMDSWIAEQANLVFVNWEITAAPGSAGQLQQSGGGTIRYVNSKGLELNQAFAKTLIGGLMADQMLNNYLSTSILDEGSNIQNNNNDIVEEGKPYTTMEHKWDEAYGYLYGNEDNPEEPVLGADSFLNTYLNQVDEDEDFAGTASSVYNAFKLGRAAIVAKNYEVRDAQVQIIRENISKVIAVRAVHYLQGGKSELAAGDQAAAFHELSEGFGFINSLQFTRKPNTDVPYFSHEEVNSFLAELMEDNGFWDVSAETLDSISSAIAARFGFTVGAAAD